MGGRKGASWNQGRSWDQQDGWVWGDLQEIPVCVVVCLAQVPFAINLAGYRERGGDSGRPGGGGGGMGPSLGFLRPQSWGSGLLPPASLAPFPCCLARAGPHCWA